MSVGVIIIHLHVKHTIKELNSACDENDEFSLSFASHQWEINMSIKHV